VVDPNVHRLAGLAHVRGEPGGDPDGFVKCAAGAIALHNAGNHPFPDELLWLAGRSSSISNTRAADSCCFIDLVFADSAIVLSMVMDRRRCRNDEQIALTILGNAFACPDLRLRIKI
jgi:hypothetical protein